MSNIFAPWARPTGRIPLTVGTGPIVGGTKNQHLWFDDDGLIYSSFELIHHYGDALPFDIDGRLVISEDVPVRVDQDIPFTASGAVAVSQEEIVRFDQGIGFSESGAIAAGAENIIVPGEYFQYFNTDPGAFKYSMESMGLTEGFTEYGLQIVIIHRIVPVAFTQYAALQNQTATNAELRYSYNFGQTRGNLRVNDALISPVNLNHTAQVPVQGQVMDYRMSFGANGAVSFEDKVDRQSDPIAVLNLLIEEFRNANGARLLAMRVVQPAPDDATMLAWPEYLPPVPIWSAIPNRENFQYELPQDYDIAAYVAGDITVYSLVTPPVGFTIAGSVITADGAGVADHTITVRAENTDFQSADQDFQWNIVLGNAPVWTPIPTQTHRVNELPKTLDVNPYVTSDSGPIISVTLVNPPAGFTILSGIVTASAGTAVGTYVLVPRATNGVGSTDTSFNWDILEELLGPQWGTIPNQTNTQSELPQVLDVTPYVTSNAGALRNWTLITPPPGFSISQAGVVTAAAGIAIAAHNIVVQVENDIGNASSQFVWTINDTLLPPQWQTIPPTSTREDLLPAPYDVSPYASSNSGPLTGWSLITPPAGFTINGSGVITAASGIAPAVYALTVEVTNDTGTTQSAPFNWEIELFFLAPVWSVIPPNTTSEGDLPVGYNVSSYATSNSGPLTGWALVAPPVGFSIDGSGLITAAAGISVGTYPITVEVSNDTGTTQSLPFNWEITLFFVVPQWSTIPAQTNGDNELPVLFDTSPYVTTNSGPLTGWALVTPPAGFTISAAGVVTAAFGTAPASYSLTVEVDNDEGTGTSDPFNWTITSVLLPPVWTTIPTQTTREDDLPDTLDTSMYVTSNSGALTGWQLVSPPAGFSINGAGLITVAGGVAPAGYSVQVRVSNNTGTTDSAVFTWNIDAFFLPPQWSTIPDQSDREDTLPQSLDASAYVTSNSGSLTGWELVSPPAGFTINTAGLITVAAGVAPTGYAIQVRVTNNTGTTSSNIFTWNIGAFFLPPQWSTIPDQSTEEQLLPVVLDVEPYVTTNHGALTSWSLVSPPGGWTIDQNGIITVAAGRVVGSYNITVRVSNLSGSSDSSAFAWDILEEPLPPQWDTIPNRQDRENTLPQNYNVAIYASSNSGPLTGWSLVSPPSGFTISGAGVITAAAGTAVAIHLLTVRVFNDEGSSDSAAFTWEIQEELLPPVWGTIPNQSDREDTLPQTLATSPYVTSNSGALSSWVLNGPSGFTISQSGVVTAGASAAVAVHVLSVQVSNVTGTSTSPDFTWTILEELLPPQWITIPNRTDSELDFPLTYSMTPYVTSNAGALDTWSLRSPPSGFSINQSGLITANGASVAAHSITVRVYNDITFSDQSFTWTIEAAPQQTYYHQFNAAIGSWDYDHVGTVQIIKLNNERQEIASETPPYLGVNYAGNTPVPNAAFEGILLEKESTNELHSSESYGSPWSASLASVSGKVINAAISLGNIRNPGNDIPYNTNFNFHIRADGNGSTSLVFINYNDVDDGQLVEEILPANGLTYLEGQFSVPSGNLRPSQGSRSGGSNREWFCDYAQAEIANYRSTYMPTTSGGSSVTTRAAARCGQDISAMGIDPNLMTDHFATQVKFKVHQNSGDANMTAVGWFGDGSNYFRIQYRTSNNRWQITIRVGGVEYLVFVNDSYVYGDEYNISVKRTPTYALKVWFNNVLVGTNANVAPGWANDLVTNMWVGSSFGLLTDESNINGTIESFRLTTGEVADSVVEGWS